MMALKVQEKELIKEQPEKINSQCKLNCKCFKHLFQLQCTSIAPFSSPSATQHRSKIQVTM